MSTSPQSHGRVSSPADLDALVGIHVTGEVPEMMWMDSHGHFQFATEAEARDALNDPYYQQFLPDLDWSGTVIRSVQLYRPYCSEPAKLWLVIARASERHGPLAVVRKQGRWWASFGKGAKEAARTPGVAVCLAALSAEGVNVAVDHDRLDAALIRRYLPGEEDGEKDGAR